MYEPYQEYKIKHIIIIIVLYNNHIIYTILKYSIKLQYKLFTISLIYFNILIIIVIRQMTPLNNSVKSKFSQTTSQNYINIKLLFQLFRSINLVNYNSRLTNSASFNCN